MSITIVSSIIAGLIISLIILTIRHIGLHYKLKLCERENESLRKSNFESNEKQKYEIIDINKKHAKTIIDLKNENSNLINEISTLKDKHAKEISKLKKNVNIKIPDTPKYNFGQYE